MPQLTVSDLAKLCGASLDGGDPDRLLTGPAPLRDARADEVSFLADPRYRHELEASAAGAVVVGLDEARTSAEVAFLRCENPGRTFTDVVQAFLDPVPPPTPGVHATAVVDPTAEVAPDASVSALAVVGPGARIASGAVVHSHAVLGANSSVGEGSELHPGVVLYAGVQVGARCVVHAAAVLGADGFGFEPTAEGWKKIPQVGTVIVEDDVEIGAGCTIDRGRFGPTRIARGVKLDDQVHIGHNVELGEDVLIVAQAGIAGSARLGPRVVIGGQAGVGGHLVIGEGARVSGGAHVYNDLEGGADYLGQPALPRREGLRRIAAVGRIAGLTERVKELERKLDELHGAKEEA